MAIVVVGGQTRNIGKTSVVAGLIAALPQLQWTAFKITQYGHGLCTADGEPCDCEDSTHTTAVTEEHDATAVTDSARFLAAGAARSFWVRTLPGKLAEAMPRIQTELASARNSIIESNSILSFLQPDLYLTLLDPANLNLKASAQKFLDRADAVLWCGRELDLAAAWPNDLLQRTRSKPQFFLESPDRTSGALTHFVAERLARANELRY